ncbi:hypothetical protein MesoLjLc_64070 [Mesorhizobium sp. L-8-10]|uniref:MAPEG family protein n=1 Tax=unclassified Mesorhizobium TaxID=325217 RepID=UPI00192919E1|nr:MULTISPECIES: MAPEG family protein [unclassified Mesorhizobium]BCH26493.1 hypothetical protein MesoLjLb_62780 [Mesorhizobium sp. L-8-3]BCH34477.1 hypothetical protein MesoLjLc_64070 [Mesorhizobium sp. L-8-10]
MLPITGTVAALASVALVALSIPVSLQRMKVDTRIGMGSDPTLLRRIRAQGNFIEYVPLALIVLALCEFRGVPAAWLYTIAILLVLGRALHVAGMLTGVTPIRASGMLGTYGALLVGAAVLALV